MDELFVHVALAEWYNFRSIYSQAFQQSLGSPVIIMVLDWDTFRLDVLASHLLNRCALAQVAVSNDWHPRAQGGHPPGIIPLRRGWSYHLVPLFRGMLMRPEAFLGLSGTCVFPSCAQTHPKNILVPHLYTWWGHIKNTLKWVIK